jgi:hypothetical protein
MASFMKMVEKDMHHYLLATLLAVFIVADMGVPPVLGELINTLLGKIIVIGCALALLFAHPLLGALGIIAAYKLIAHSDHHSAPVGVPTIPMPRARRPSKQAQGEKTRTKNLSAMNQFPPTVEEEVIRKMLPQVPARLPRPTFKPVLDKLHDAARVNASN